MDVVPTFQMVLSLVLVVVFVSAAAGVFVFVLVVVVAEVVPAEPHHAAPVVSLSR